MVSSDGELCWCCDAMWAGDSLVQDYRPHWLSHTASLLSPASTTQLASQHQQSLSTINNQSWTSTSCKLWSVSVTTLIVFFNLNDKPITYTDFIGLYLTVWHHHVIWLQHCRNQPFKFLIKIPPPCFPIPIRPTELIKMWEEPPGLLWWRLARKIVKFIHFN